MEEKKNYKICIKCFNDENVDKIMKPIIHDLDRCDICESVGSYCVTKTNINYLKNYFHCILAYYIDERFYEKSTTACEYVALFSEAGLIKDASQKNVFEKIFGDIFVFDEDSIIEVDNEYCYRSSIMNETESYIQKRLIDRYHGYAGLVSDIDDLFNDIKDHLNIIKSIPSAYRARVGYAIQQKVGLKTLLTGEKYHIPCALNGDDLQCPPSAKVNGGRANRQGLPFLYIAENEETAIAEVRPTPGDYVSICEFESTRELDILDFTSHDLRYFSESKDRMEILRIVSNINNIFSLPKGSGNNHYYLPTQLMCEKILLSGYDGVCYKSSFTGKRNYAIFQPNDLRLKECSAKLTQVKKIKIISETIKIA